MATQKANAQVYDDGVVEVSTVEPNLMMENESTLSAKVEYELPFPGMLPDNPFYSVKMLRDKIVKSLISDPFKKAQFNLLTSQKRMFAGRLLLEKKKTALALDTIEKSNNYLDDAIHDIKQAKSENSRNTDIKPFLEHFKTVTLKYGEIMKDMKNKIDSKNSKRFEIQVERVKGFQKTVEALIKQY